MDTQLSNGLATGPEEARYVERFERLRKEKGLVDVKFAKGNVDNSTPESFFREANLLMDLVERGDLEESSFGDSSLNQH